MPLTAAQLSTLKTFFSNDASMATLKANVGTEAQDNVAIRDAFNAASTFVVWRTTTPVEDIQDAISWDRMTPNQAPDGTQTWANKALHAQGKQFNLQNLLLGRSSIPSAKPNWRSAFQDALSNLPTKSDGTNQDAGTAAVKTAMERFATVAEKQFATGTGSAGTPGSLVWEGSMTTDEVVAMLAS